MKHLNRYFSLLFITLLHGLSQLNAMEAVENAKSSRFSPEPYVRKNVEQQCEAYRLIFDKVFQDTKAIQKDNLQTTDRMIWEIMSDTAAPGLIDILKDGVKIVQDYIKSPLYMQSPKKQDSYVKLVDRFWSLSLRIENQHEFSANSFTLLNLFLAYLFDTYKYQEDYSKNFENFFSIVENYQDDQFYWENMLSTHLGVRIFQGIPGSLECPRFCPLKRPVFIIYAHPNSNVRNREISLDTFVKEYLGYDYPVDLAVFDIHSNSSVQSTKKDPHYSVFKGTYALLDHDIQHSYIISMEDEKTSVNGDNRLYLAFKEGHAIKEKLEREGRHDDAITITSGLFMLFHEPSLLQFTPYLVTNNSIKTLRDKATHLMNHNRLSTRLRYTENVAYKQGYRDYEFILRKAKNKNGSTFLPMITLSTEKQRPLPIAKKENEYVIIEKQDDFKEDTKLVMSHRDIPKNILHERNRRLAYLLDDAYHHFWNYFTYLIEQ